MQSSSKNYSQYANPPITKIGAIVRLKPKIASEPPRYLVVQPKGDAKKNAKEAPPYVLPRGTRMYTDPDTGKTRDARDEKTAQRFADHLESPLETAARELEEEAGVPREMFYNKAPVEFGAWEYASVRSYRGYPIVWYGIALEEGDLNQLTKAVDSARVAWMSVAEYDKLVKDGNARAGYAAVIKRADSLFS